MDVEILNLYSNEPMPDTKLIGDHGQNFLIKTDTENILLDVGTSGIKLLHNMNLLNVDLMIFPYSFFPMDIMIIVEDYLH